MCFTMKFIVTKEAGKLARWLRILGYDTIYYTGIDKGRLIIEALRDGRIIITRSKGSFGVLKTKTVHVCGNEVSAQLKEVLRTLSLSVDKKKMFSRCAFCNHALCVVEKHTVERQVPSFVFQTHDVFRRCPACGKVYWEGTHWGNIRETIEKIIN